MSTHSKTTSPVKNQYVVLHGWHRLDRNGELCRETGLPEYTQINARERPDVEPDGWCVYLRTDPVHMESGDFEDSHEQDATSLAAARAYAEHLAVEHQVEWYEE